MAKHRRVKKKQAGSVFRPAEIIVDPRIQGSPRDMSMYFCPDNNSLKIKPIKARSKGHYDRIFDLLVADSEKRDSAGKKDFYAEKIAISAERIHQGKWLDDLAIQGYISFLCNQTEGKMATLPSGHLPQGLVSVNFCEELRSPIRRLRQTAALRDADYIICPIHCNNHWFVMILCKGATKVNKITYSAYCWDSLNQWQEHSKFFNSAKRIIQALHPEKSAKLASCESYLVPAQHNLNDCGVAACYYIDRFAQLFKARKFQAIQSGYFLNIYQQFAEIKCDYSQFRDQILKTFHTWYGEERAEDNQPALPRRLHFQYGKQTSPRVDIRQLIDLTTPPLIKSEDGKREITYRL